MSSESCDKLRKIEDSYGTAYMVVGGHENGDWGWKSCPRNVNMLSVLYELSFSSKSYKENILKNVFSVIIL
jgi:hypothetical protein